MVVQFFGGVIFFGIIANFIPEPTLAPSSDVRGKKVVINFSPSNWAICGCFCIWFGIILLPQIEGMFDCATIYITTEKWGWRGQGHFEEASPPSSIQWDNYSNRYTTCLRWFKLPSILFFELDDNINLMLHVELETLVS